MRTRSFLALAVLSVSFLGFAKAHAARAVSDMTCAQAVAFVEKNKMYYKETADGVLPIYPVKPVSKDPVCGHKESLWWVFEATTDDTRCHIGYQCESSN